MSRNPRTVKRIRAPLRASTYAASVPLNRVFTGTRTPPAVVTASAATIHSAEFGAQTATRSPRAMPRGEQRPRAATSTVVRQLGGA